MCGGEVAGVCVGLPSLPIRAGVGGEGERKRKAESQGARGSPIFIHLGTHTHTHQCFLNLEPEARLVPLLKSPPRPPRPQG